MIRTDGAGSQTTLVLRAFMNDAGETVKRDGGEGRCALALPEHD